MPVADPFASEIPSGIGLRTELSLRGLRYASVHGLQHERSDGGVPGVLFGPHESGTHGNFHNAAYARIRATPEWARRLEKAHTGWKRAWVRAAWQWRELDSAHSSDALLMNIFCHPETIGRAASMLGVPADAAPVFGFRPRTPLQSKRFDRTEIDMQLGNLLIEAKLTESDFQWARPELVLRYRDLNEVFDYNELPRRDGRQSGYQLIRGVLAAYASGQMFCVLCDARRPELIEAWYRTLRAVRLSELRCGMKLLTWQELAGYLSQDLQEFLAAKYGILPGRETRAESA